MGFIEDIAPLVQKYAKEYGIGVCSPIIAQGVLESQSGKSELGVNAMNFFGMKYREGRVPCASGVYYKVGSEQNKDGTYVSSNMKWLKFNSYDSAIHGYFQFINVPTYANLKGVTDPRRYLELIKKDGYATSLKYVDNLMAVIDKYDLTKYDGVTGYYRVQCGAYKLKANAIVLQLRLKLKGYESIIKQIDGLYKCQIGAYGKELNAKIMLDKLNKNGFNCFITYN